MPEKNETPRTLSPDNTEETIENAESHEIRKSRLFLAFIKIFEIFVYASFWVLLAISLFTLDFLDVIQFRYSIPENWRSKWPLSRYYDFVALHQLPEEARYQEMLRRERQRYQEAINDGSSDLKRRASELESSYRELSRTNEEHNKKLQDDLALQMQKLHSEKAEILKLQDDLEGRKKALDILYQQFASETINLESSLIRFMEGENRLKPVQEIGASMDPRSLAGIFDEVADNKLIYRILTGIPPERAALILSFMDPEKAGKIIKMSQLPPELPEPGKTRSYIPPSLENLIASFQANLR